MHKNVITLVYNVTDLICAVKLSNTEEKQLRSQITGKKKDGKNECGAHTPPLTDSLLLVVMVIRGFGQDYEIFYLVTSARLQRTCKPA